MMAKIVKGSGTRGIVDYILDKKKQATLIDCQGVLFNDNSTIAKSFIAQSRLNPRVDKFIGHISLSFSKQDLPRLTNELMIQISREYMEKMGIRDTQYIIGRHYDKEHPHVHIAFNRVDNHGRTISDRNDRYRSERICKELTRKYGLYFANGKEQVKTHRLKEPDKTRYEIYQVLKRDVARCSDWTTLLKRLKAEGIDVRFKYKGNTNEVQGIVFTKNGYHFNGSKIDRSFSYSKIDKALNGNNQAEYQRQYEPHHMQISHFDNKESELISGSLGLLDFTSSPDVDSKEEAEFRRLMQQKPKKKRTRGFKL